MKSAKKKTQKQNSFTPQIYKDRRGVVWITAEGIKKYFRVSLPANAPLFYRYDDVLKGRL